MRQITIDGSTSSFDFLDNLIREFGASSGESTRALLIDAPPECPEIFAHPNIQKISKASPTVTVLWLTEDQPIHLVALLTIAPWSMVFTQVYAGGGRSPSSGEFAVTANTIKFHSDDIEARSCPALVLLP